MNKPLRWKYRLDKFGDRVLNPSDKSLVEETRRVLSIKAEGDEGFAVYFIQGKVAGERWGGDVRVFWPLELLRSTVHFWQEKGWLGPLPKRVPKTFRDALEGVE